MDQIQEKANVFQNVTTKSVVKYAFLPGILPQLGRIATAISRFLFMFTTLFGAVGLIDRSHPCLRPENIGRYRFTDVVGLAASRVVFDRKHQPQTIMFFTIIGSIVLLVAIFGVSIAQFVFHTGEANAQYFGQAEPPDSNVPYTPKSDWAFQFLHRIFGNSDYTGIGFWGGDQTGQNAINPWYSSLFAYMLKHYSYALLVIAAFMVLYLLIITVAESARTGQPFGTRFDSVWAPIRLAMAIGLLVPVSGAGYNGAQLIAFQVSEWGSNLATNIWFKAIKDVEDQEFVAVSVSDPGIRFLRDMFLMNVCVEGLKAANAQGKIKLNKVDAYVGEDDKAGLAVRSYGLDSSRKFCGSLSWAYMSPVPLSYSKIKKVAYWPDMVAQGYDAAATWFFPSDDPVGRKSMHDLAKNYAINYMCCKDKTLSQIVLSMGYKPGLSTPSTPAKPADSAIIKEWVACYWHLAFSRNEDKTLKFLESKTWKEREENAEPYFPPANTGFAMFETHGQAMQAYNKWVMSSLKQDEANGWAAAGVFYLRLTNAMATLDRVVQNPPNVTTLPAPLRNQKMTANGSGTGSGADIIKACDFVTTGLGMKGGKISEICTDVLLTVVYSDMLSKAANWFDMAIAKDSDMYTALGGASLDKELAIPDRESVDAGDLGSIMGPIQQKLYNNVKVSSYTLNPLGEVVRWGSIFMTISTTLYLFSIVMSFWSGGLATIAMTLANVMMIPGFTLAFIVPMLPFLYFTFGVIEWMISIIEAVIGMPLWALSFITLEGDALGQGLKGVKMLFEITLRPTILVLSLLVAVLIFTASVKFFNDSMDSVASAYSQAEGSTANMFTAPWLGLGMIFMYMLGVYSLATSCFKLINIIPDQFGRWMNLEPGFGSQMKAGVNEMTGLLAGGAVVTAIGGVSSGVSQMSNERKAKKDRKQALAEKLQQLTQDAQDQDDFVKYRTQGGGQATYQDFVSTKRSLERNNPGAVKDYVETGQLP